MRDCGNRTGEVTQASAGSFAGGPVVCSQCCCKPFCTGHLQDLPRCLAQVPVPRCLDRVRSGSQCIVQRRSFEDRLIGWFCTFQLFPVTGIIKGIVLVYSSLPVSML